MPPSGREGDHEVVEGECGMNGFSSLSKACGCKFLLQNTKFSDSNIQYRILPQSLRDSSLPEGAIKITSFLLTLTALPPGGSHLTGTMV